MQNQSGDLPAHLPGINMEKMQRWFKGNNDLCISLLQTFDHEYGQTVRLMTRACEKNNLKWVRRTAHSIKGVAAIFGAQSLQHAAADLEQAAADGNLTANSGTITRFNDALAEVLGSISRIRRNETEEKKFAPPAHRMAKARHRILIVDDDPLTIDILVDVLGSEYETLVAENGRQGLRMVAQNAPDLILLDIMMPDMDGYAVCKLLKTNPKTRDIPVIFITALHEGADEYRGLDIGAIDYVIKPINPQIVKVRVKNHLNLRTAMLELEMLNRLALDANPNTGLPGNNSVAEAINQALSENHDICVIHADLDFFKPFNDKYGFARGDDVIRFTAGIFKDVIAGHNGQQGFIGHIGGDDFILLIGSDQCRRVCEEIIRRFDDGITRFYDQKDAQSGCIAAKDRQERNMVFPIMSISLAGVDLSQQAFRQYLEVNDACAEVKKRVKSIPGSCFHLDQRSPTGNSIHSESASPAR